MLFPSLRSKPDVPTQCKQLEVKGLGKKNINQLSKMILDDALSSVQGRDISAFG
ncbi:hypothetical protein [Legionella maioricensis]|uniref:Uncharacterized protein n=1 Tax=Legionella maioricensis TaxID=2896528 RepID=A0A9X2D2K0_9GAMM|nr:hypothetical protein [Legionella maioricensis]MCL9684537.1 hypothetical protein [Legionella maioricensis]MCL9687869.1 hypothetical protein [Legionella maioricensis]